MLSYWLKYRKNTESKMPKIEEIKSGRIVLSSNSAVCCNKKSRFIKGEEVSGWWSSFGIKIPFSQNPVVGRILFEIYKINEILNTFLLAGGKFIPKMHLSEPGFALSVCGLFTKNKERIKYI